MTNTITISRADSIQDVFVCSECGSDNVEYKMWVNPNTNAIGTDCDEDAYCNACERQTGAVMQSDFEDN